MRLAAELAFLVVAAVGAAICLASLGRRLPQRERVFEAAVRPRRPSDSRPAQLMRLERTVASARSSALDLHARLRPVLVEIAETALARRGVRLERDAADAERLLGPAAWELLRPGRPLPEDRHAAGIEAQELEQILDALEEL